MKKTEIVIAAMLLLPLAALTQEKYTGSKADTAAKKNVAVSNSGIVPISHMDQRKIYRWANGQRSTATGRQAGERNVAYAKVFGDSAVVEPDPYKKG